MAARLEPGESIAATLVNALTYKWRIFATKEYQVVVTDRRVILLEREAGSFSTEGGLLGAALTAVELAQDAVRTTVVTDYPRDAVSLVKFKRGRIVSTLALAHPDGVLTLKVVRTYRDDAEAIAGLLRPRELGTAG